MFWREYESQKMIKEWSFLSKIQNHISEKYLKENSTTVFNFLNSKFQCSRFSFKFLIQFFKVVVFPSNFWNTTIIWQVLRVILIFLQIGKNFKPCPFAKSTTFLFNLSNMWLKAFGKNSTLEEFQFLLQNLPNQVQFDDIS